MSPLWFRIYDGMIDRGSATLAGIDGCHAKGLLTDAEHAALTTKWNSLNPPAVEEPTLETEPEEDAEDAPVAP